MVMPGKRTFKVRIDHQDVRRQANKGRTIHRPLALFLTYAHHLGEFSLLRATGCS